MGEIVKDSECKYCHGEIIFYNLSQPMHIICANCRKIYPIEEAIPKNMAVNPHIDNYHLIHLQFSIKVETLTNENLLFLKDMAKQIKYIFESKSL